MMVKRSIHEIRVENPEFYQMGKDLDWNANKPPSDSNLVLTRRERLGFSVAQLVAMKTQIPQNVKKFTEEQFEKVTEGRPL